jgi:hypothetical protein
MEQAVVGASGSGEWRAASGKIGTRAQGHRCRLYKPRGASDRRKEKIKDARDSSRTFDEQTVNKQQKLAKKGLWS